MTHEKQERIQGQGGATPGPSGKAFTRLPPLEGRNNPCLQCPPILPVLDMRRRIAVGFGDAHLERDGETVWSEDGREYEKCLTVAAAERRARKEPDRDWRIVLNGPLHGETYQRHGQNQWVLVEKNKGFA